MPEVSNYLDEIDQARQSRVRELSELKYRFSATSDDGPFLINSKTAIVLAYSHWEGFYNDCVNTYIKFLKDRKCTVRLVSWSMMAGALSSALARLKDRNHSNEARSDFIDAILKDWDCDFQNFDASTISARSNLDFQKISENFRVLNFDANRFNAYRNRINKELVGWRHSVAHGDVPDLSEMNIESHLNFTSGVMLEMSDIFQEQIVRLS